MRRLSKCVFAAFACLLLGFSATPCHAQDEVRLLHAGLLGYTGGIEDEALLLSPAAIGQVFSGGGAQPKSSLALRLGSHTFKNDIIDRAYGAVPFFGFGFTNSISDTLSSRFSLDFAYTDGSGSYSDLSLFMMPMKAGVLLHPGTIESNEGYFKPYIGVGLDLSFIVETSDYYYDDISGWGFGLHGLLGFEFVINTFSLALEFGYSAVETSFDIPGSDSVDTGGLLIALNAGFAF